MSSDYRVAACKSYTVTLANHLPRFAIATLCGIDLSILPNHRLWCVVATFGGCGVEQSLIESSNHQ